MVLPSRLGQLLEQRRRALAILDRIDTQIEGVLGAAEDVEDLLVETAARRGRQIFKAFRSTPRGEPVGASTRTQGLFQRVVLPILRTLGETLISGSGTFSDEDLAEAEIQVWFNTETGFFAEMRFTPNGPPMYKAITREEADLLRSPTPPTNLIARLFTEQEPVDH